MQRSPSWKNFCSVNLLFWSKFHYYSKKLKLSKSLISFLWLVFFVVIFFFVCLEVPPPSFWQSELTYQILRIHWSSVNGETQKWSPPFQTGQVRVEVHLFSYKTAVSERQGNKKIYEVSVQQNCEQKTYKINRSA